MAARERCVPGGERGSFEDHGEGDPDVLVSPANRRGTKASMCVPRRESSRPRLPGGAGSICSANPTQPRTLSKNRTVYRVSWPRGYASYRCVSIAQSIDTFVVRLRRSNVIAPACLKMTVGGGGEGEGEGGGRGRGGKIEKVRIIGWCESKKRRVIESNADEQRASSVMIA